MQAFIAFVISLLHLAHSANPPNLLQQTAMHLMRIEKELHVRPSFLYQNIIQYFKDHSTIIKQALIDGDSILDVRMIIDALEESAHLVSTDCKQVSYNKWLSS